MKYPQKVDWDHPELRPKPRRNRPYQRETQVRVTCQNPTCGYERWLTIHDAKHAERTGACKIEAAQNAYRAAVAKHGKTHMQRKMREHQLLNPSKPEHLFYHWLLALGADDLTELDRPTTIQLTDSSTGFPVRPRYCFERQVVIKTNDRNFYPDFLLGNDLLVEVDGYHHEALPERQLRDRTLDTVWPGTVLHIPASALAVTKGDCHHHLLAQLWEILYSQQVPLPTTFLPLPVNAS
jgi:hypothetical protein